MIWIFTLISIILFPFFVIPFLFGVHGLGNITGTIVCILLFIWACILRKEYQVPKWISYSVRSLFIILLVMTIVITGFMTTGFTPKGQPTQTIVVLGCGIEDGKPSRPLLERLQTAYTYMMENESSVAILTGGQGSDEEISEAEGMYRWLVEQGINENRLIKEDQSISTVENIALTKAIMEEKEMDMHITLVTNEFHMYRASQLAKEQEFIVSTLPAYSAWYLFPTHYVRELYAIVAYWIGLQRYSEGIKIRQ